MMHLCDFLHKPSPHSRTEIVIVSFKKQISCFTFYNNGITIPTVIGYVPRIIVGYTINIEHTTIFPDDRSWGKSSHTVKISRYLNINLLRTFLSLSFHSISLLFTVHKFIFFYFLFLRIAAGSKNTYDLTNQIN